MKILNAASMSLQDGIKDNSIKTVTPEQPSIPQHLPLSFIFSPLGRKEKRIVGSKTIGKFYGFTAFTEDEKYFNHSTRFLRDIFMANGNYTAVKRVVPTDAKKANFVLYMDVLYYEKPNFVRNDDGTYALDANGDKITDANNPTIMGYTVQYFIDKLPLNHVTGSITPSTGFITPSDTTTGDNANAVSTLYPLMELQAHDEGEAYNLFSLLFKPTTTNDVDSRITKEGFTYPYNLTIYGPDVECKTSTLMRNLSQESETLFTFKPKAKNILSGKQFGLKTVIEKEYFNENNLLKPLSPLMFDNIYIYDQYVGELLKNITKGIMDAFNTGIIINGSLDWYDMADFEISGPTDPLIDVEVEKQKYVVNFLTAKSLSNVDYVNFDVSMEFVTLGDPGDKTLTSFVYGETLDLRDGSDGTINDVMFNQLVEAEMNAYADENSDVMDTAINKETIIYDSGFPLDTKLALTNFITIRKNTCVILSTHDDSLQNKVLSLTDSRAIAQTLKSRLKLNPESMEFGTGVARAAIVLGGGDDASEIYETKLPVTYELADKLSKRMGAGNYEWNKDYPIDNAADNEGNVFKKLINVEPKIPIGMRPLLHADGILYSQPYDRCTNQFPGLQTVYENDTSVLNSLETTLACCTLSSIADDAHRQYTGDTDLDPDEFAVEVVNYVNKRVKGKFAGKFVIIPEVEFTDTDKQRGYSWRLITKLYANNMKTVMVYRTEVYRKSDLIN